MTEESDDYNDPNAIVLHKLPWHSESKPDKCVHVYAWVEFLLQVVHFVALNSYIDALDT